ncbi:MAG: DUF11 domain-containing protein, partial [Fibrobacter sp.]|nr:DUF11 domain-containing protein [Fibrobacter sp.]
CVTNVGGDKTIGFWGPEVLKDWYSPSGKPLGTFGFNWVPGAGSPAAVVSQNHDLMAELYRCLEIKWDGTGDDRYLGSVPHYFHGWFRLLGMLVLSGNHHSPTAIKPTANMKVYCDVNKTFVFQGDEVTYTLSYRNYGSVSAQDVKIIDTLPQGMTYVSSTKSGSFDQSSNTVTWNIGTVAGFKTAEPVSNSTGEITLTLRADETYRGQCRNRAAITCSNGSGWTSNEYPNTISATLKRNFVDVIGVSFKDTTKGKVILPLHGGRPGVHFSYSAEPMSGSNSPSNKLQIRLFHDADEAYINYGNYRVSYFLYDAENTCYNDESCSNGWQVTKQICEGVAAKSITVSHEKLVPVETTNGKLNQRIIIQFSDALTPGTPENIATTTYFLDWYKGVVNMVHRGVVDPLRIVWDIHNGTNTGVNWGDDWSWSEDVFDGNEKSAGFPVTPDFTDPLPDNTGVAVDRQNPKQCKAASKAFSNILIEEWDGYTWRQVFGNSPYTTTTSVPHVTKKFVPNKAAIKFINSSIMRFYVPVSGDIQMQLMDIQGRIVSNVAKKHYEAGTHSVILPLKNRAASNVYLVRLITKHGTIMKKIPCFK